MAKTGYLFKLVHLTTLLHSGPPLSADIWWLATYSQRSGGTHPTRMLFCLQIGLSEQHLSHLARACLPYLSTSQPAALQDTCLQAFREFILLEPGSVWLLLIETYCSSLPQPPHRCFKPLKVIFVNVLPSSPETECYTCFTVEVEACLLLTELFNSPSLPPLLNVFVLLSSEYWSENWSIIHSVHYSHCHHCHNAKLLRCNKKAFQ